MEYELKIEKAFSKRMDNLVALFGLSFAEAKEARITILDCIEHLVAGK
ncbi:MAG: hypothetical protein LBL38_02255 [Lactobacillales bacterium]|jgi:hypothetical protein|nr:hypothetical protein [Lactobacillales bacterium]